MKKFLAAAIVMVTTVFWLASLTAADRITLIGEVNDNNQIIADNQIYEVENNAAGDDLVLNYIAQKVKIVGQLKVVKQSNESDEYKVITVESFEVVKE